MNAAHLHLITSHAPAFAILFGLILWLAGLALRSVDFRRAALLLFVLAGLLSAPAFLSGKPAFRAIQAMPGLNRDATDQHEEVAVLAFAVTALLGLGSLSGLVAFRRSGALPRWFGGLILTGALASGALMGWTASLGGKARHTEIGQTPR
jgi:hypothetical protein